MRGESGCYPDREGAFYCLDNKIHLTLFHSKIKEGELGLPEYWDLRQIRDDGIPLCGFFHAGKVINEKTRAFGLS